MHNNNAFKILSLACRRVIFTIHLAKQRLDVCEWGRDGVMFMCAHVFVYDVALCGNTIRNVALVLWIFGNPCYNCYIGYGTTTNY